MVIGENVRGILSNLLKERIFKMKTRCYYQAEVLELEYTDKFHAYLEFESVEAGLRCEITLADADGENEFMIGAITSPDYEIGRMHEFAENMLNNAAYCNEIWRRRMREKRRKTNAAH